MTTIKSTLMNGLLIGMALWLTACGGSSNSSKPVVTQPEPPAPVQPTPLDYQALIDQAVTNGLTGVTLLVESSDERFLGSAGVSNKDTLEPMTVDAVMPAGSAGKSITAVLALILQQDGMLDLDAPISLWLEEDLLSQIEHSDKMTLRQLLNHTSGIFEYLHNDQFGLDIINAPDELRLDEQVIQYVLNQPANFEPGAGFSYSNSGYVLAGLVLDKVLGYHHSIAVRERILDPVGMNNTFYLGAEGDKGQIISGYRALSDFGLSEDETPQDVKPILFNLGVGDAPVASTVEDYFLYQRALLNTGTLLGEEATNQFVGQEYLLTVDEDYHLENSTLEYGLGIFKETNSSNTLLHHDGDQFGWLTYNLYWEEQDMSIIMMVNCAGAVCKQQSSQVISAILNQ